MNYWENLTTGSICCEKHLGAYLYAGIASKPKAKTHQTPLGKCQLMKETEVSYLTENYGIICEGCMTVEAMKVG